MRWIRPQGADNMYCSMTSLYWYPLLNKLIYPHCWLPVVWNFVRCPKSLVYFPSFSFFVVIHSLIRQSIKHTCLCCARNMVFALPVNWGRHINKWPEQQKETFSWKFSRGPWNGNKEARCLSPGTTCFDLRRTLSHWRKFIITPGH